MDTKHNQCDVTAKWLDDTAYQTILMKSHMIAFEYDTVEKKQRVSPFIGEYIAGNYDGRLLSDVMIEDGVIHPDDLYKSIVFRQKITSGQLGEMVLRLLTPEGKYKWFRMVMTIHSSEGSNRLLVGILEDVDIQMQYQELLRHRAEIDPVSQIYNRETFFVQTERMLKLERSVPHFLLCFDVDRFKLINEMYGTQEGNNVLKYIGSVLKEHALNGETYGRLGNDVFGMCVGRSRSGSIFLMRKIARDVQSYPLPFSFSLPTGIVPIAPGSEEHTDVLCDRASMARYRIKGNYLRSYAFYEPAMGNQLSREHELIVNMEAALKNNQFEAYYQPQYNVENGSIIGAEALARWLHPTLGMISPLEFVPLFERNGFIVKLDEYIWETACRTIRRLMDMGIQPVPISVNVSRVHLYNDDLCGKIKALCSKYDVPRNMLILEITESAYTKQTKELLPAMDSLRQAGFTLSMDDFGSGYSSLNILKDIPIDIVKLDLRFLEEARNGEQTGRIIMKNVVRLFRDLRLSFITEGVENEGQAQFLKEIGCYFVQGFYYARPMTSELFEDLLGARIQIRQKDDEPSINA